VGMVVYVCNPSTREVEAGRVSAANPNCSKNLSPNESF
jgi:hypothetical protein